MRNGILGWAFALLTMVLGCGGGSTTTPDARDVPGDQQEGSDGEEVDGGGDADAGADADGGDADAVGDADAGETAKQTGISLTAGGGRATSPGYQLTLSIGAPQPMGAAESGTNRVQVGPGAVVNQ